MRKLVVIEFLSLDGVMQAPGAPDEDRDGGFRHGGWALPYYDEVMVGAAVEGMEETDAFLFGRRTYQTFAAYWPTAPTEIPFTAKLNSTPKYVASTTLERVEWENSTLLEGDVPSAVADLKRRNGKNIAILGSSGLVQTLIGQDLIDEYSLTVHPIVLGGGKRLFRDDGQLRRMQLADSKTTSMGSLLLTYHPRLTRRSKGSGEPPAGVVTSIEHLIRNPFTATRPSPCHLGDRDGEHRLHPGRTRSPPDGALGGEPEISSLRPSSVSEPGGGTLRGGRLGRAESSPEQPPSFPHARSTLGPSRSSDVQNVVPEFVDQDPPEFRS